MATASRVTLALNTSSCWKTDKRRIWPTSFKIRASSDDSDCNSEECAPEKEVGKVSMEWIAEERTKVVGTFPPRTRGWTGYVEKDTAGQTNIYSVEPPVYIAESAISSGSAGSSADGSENTAGLIAFIAIISVAAASSVLFQVGKTPTTSSVQTPQYSGPALAYYINKFTPPEVVQVSVPTEDQPQSSTSVAETSPEAQVQAQPQAEPSSPSEAPSVNVN